MLNYYFSKNEKFSTYPNESKSLNFEEEQKYLAILRKQMKKLPEKREESETKHDPLSNINVNNQPVAENAEFFDRWRKLVNKSNENKTA